MDDGEKGELRAKWGESFEAALAFSLTSLPNHADWARVPVACAVASFYFGIHVGKAGYEEQDTGEALRILIEELNKTLNQAQQIATKQALDAEYKGHMSGN